MKVKRLIMALALALVLAGPGAKAADIGGMMAAAVKQPTVRLSAVAAAEGRLRKDAADTALYPKVIAWSRFESFNSPTGLRPMAPTEVNGAGDSIPFSRDILRYGLNLDVPVYIGEILALRQKAEVLADKADLAHRGKISGQEAAVVSLNSSFLYLTHLDAAIAARLTSLEKTRSDLGNKVRSGRSPGAELLKVENTINDLLVQRNGIANRIIDVRRDLKHVTGLEITEPAAMRMAGEIVPGAYLAERLARADRDAAGMEVKRRRLARYPKVSLLGSISGNDGEAYNTDSHIFRRYSSLALVLSIPLYDKTLKTDLAIARAEEKKAEHKLADTRLELSSLEKALRSNLVVLSRSQALQKKSLLNAEDLLRIARASFDSGRTTTEEYLRYESQVLASRAALLATDNEVWQIRARLSTLYGQPLEEIVK